MTHKFDPVWKENLDNAEHRQLEPETILDRLPIKETDRIADIGCGTGFFTIPLARRLHHGKVLALDISAEMLGSLRQKLTEERITNVEASLCGEADFPIEPASLDGALLFFVLHETDNRSLFLWRVATLLRPGGWVAVLEWQRVSGGPPGPPLQIRLDPTETKSLALATGLSVATEAPLGTYYHLLLLQK